MRLHDKLSYQPGEKGRITAIFTFGVRTGLQDKTIRVDVHGEKEPTTLSIPGRSMDDAKRAMTEAQSLMGLKAQWTLQMMEARRACWAAYPSGKNVAELGRTYAQALEQKNYYYFFLKSLDLSSSVRTGAQILSKPTEPVVQLLINAAVADRRGGVFLPAVVNNPTAEAQRFGPKRAQWINLET